VPTVKIGIQTRSLRQPIRQALSTAARLGAAGVEIDARSELRPHDVSRTGIREFHKLMDDMNLRVAAIAFPTRRGYDVPDDLERRVLATQEAMRFAADLRADVVILRAGRIPSESEAFSSSRLVESLTALGVFGNHIGVRPALQTADVLPADLLRLIQALPDQTVGVDLNPSELIKAGHSPRETVELLGSHVLHVHACDAVRDIVTRDGIEVELGRGAADMPELLGHLTEFDYRGWVTIERRDSPNPTEEIENAVAYLRSL
jgi:sugar phosphate isomerase/epimerase